MNPHCKYYNQVTFKTKFNYYVSNNEHFVRDIYSLKRFNLLTKSDSTYWVSILDISEILY